MEFWETTDTLHPCLARALVLSVERLRFRELALWQHEWIVRRIVIVPIKRFCVCVRREPPSMTASTSQLAALEPARALVVFVFVVVFCKVERCAPELISRGECVAQLHARGQALLDRLDVLPDVRRASKRARASCRRRSTMLLLLLLLERSREYHRATTSVRVSSA